jgi:hypothetical protein
MDLDAKITQQEAKKLLQLSTAQVSRLVRKWIRTDGEGKVTPREVFRGHIYPIDQAWHCEDRRRSEGCTARGLYPTHRSAR